MATVNVNEPMLFGAMVEKFSMGRSTGIQVKNWQKRYLAIFPSGIAYYVNEDAYKKKQKPKFEAGIKNFSLCILNATEQDHVEAKGPLLFILRVWAGGVFDILVRPNDPSDKAQFMAAIRKATENIKGFQMVGDSEVLGGEDKFDRDEDGGDAPSVPKARVLKKKKEAEPEESAEYDPDLGGDASFASTEEAEVPAEEDDMI